MRTELKIGFFLFAASMALKCLTPAPEFVMGLTLGLTICFEVVGILPEKAYQAVKRFKKSLFAFR